MTSLRRNLTTLLALIVLTAGACGKKADVDQLTSSLGEILAAPKARTTDAAWKDVQAFYAQRQQQPIWVDRKGPTSKSKKALDVLDSAAAHGLVPDDYHASHLRQEREALKDAKDSAPGQMARLAKFDAELTTSLLTLGRDVALGRTSPKAITSTWKARRAPLNFPVTLAQAAQGDMSLWLNAVRPHHTQYAALQAVLADPAKLAAAGGDEIADVIALNLERWRWMPDDLGAQHLMVNIPSFSLAARENGKTVLSMRVVVGKPKGNETPIVSGKIENVVFSPSWGIPESIASTETARHIERDPNYLAREGIEIVRVNDRDVYRQKPGPRNALGQVKFLFPNDYDVYLHDTPSRSFFAKDMRALSHGCVRLEQPEHLARYILRDETTWTDERIRRAMQSGVEQFVKTKVDVPVHLVYFTAVVDDAGTLTFPRDIYGYDARQKNGELKSKS